MLLAWSFLAIKVGKDALERFARVARKGLSFLVGLPLLFCGDFPTAAPIVC